MFALPRTTTPLKAGIESYDTRQRRRDRRLRKKIDGDVVAAGPGSRALVRLAESEIGEARYGHRLFTANDRESTGIVEFMPEL